MNDKELNRIEEMLNIQQSSPVEEGLEEVQDSDDEFEESAAREIAKYTDKPIKVDDKDAGELIAFREKRDDVEKVRENLFDLVNQSKESIDGILQVAQESDSPRAYEVLAGLIKTSLETNQAIIKMHTDLEPKNAPNTGGPTNIENAVFVGSTADLLEQIEAKSKKVKNESEE